MPWFGSWNSCIHCWAVCITGSRVETFSQSIQQWLFLFGKKSVNVLNPNVEYGNEQNKRESTAPNKTLWKDVRPMESGHWYQWYLNDGIKLLQCICAAKMNCNRQILCLQHHCNTNGHLEELRQEKRIVCTNWNSLFQLNNQANWCWAPAKDSWTWLH